MELVKPGATKEYIVQSLQWCVSVDRHEELKAMLSTYFRDSKLSDMTGLCSELLCKVVSNGSRDQLQLLLSYVDKEFLFNDKTRTGHNLNDTTTTGNNLISQMLTQAVIKGNVKTAELLFENGAEIDTIHKGKNLLTVAIENGHTDVVKLLVTRGAKVENTLIPVIQSSIKQKEETVELLFKHGAGLHQLGASGRQPIHVASANSASLVNKLVQLGCDVNAKDPIHGDTPMHVACGMCCRDVVEILIKHGAAFNGLNYQGETPLYKLLKFASNFRLDFHAHSRIELASFLVQLGFEIPQQNKTKTRGRKHRGRDKVHDLYQRVVASSKHVYTLQHMCRLDIRKNIQPEMLNFLDIPAYLIKFLKFSDGFQNKAVVSV